MNSDLRADLLIAVDQQILSLETPYVGETYHRLLQLGIVEDAAKYQIACCLCEEMDQLLINGRKFDQQAYRVALDALPADFSGDED